MPIALFRGTINECKMLDEMIDNQDWSIVFLEMKLAKTQFKLVNSERLTVKQQTVVVSYLSDNRFPEFDPSSVPDLRRLERIVSRKSIC